MKKRKKERKKANYVFEAEQGVNKLQILIRTKGSSLYNQGQWARWDKYWYSENYSEDYSLNTNMRLNSYNTEIKSQA